MDLVMRQTLKEGIVIIVLRLVYPTILGVMEMEVVDGGSLEKAKQIVQKYFNFGEDLPL